MEYFGRGKTQRERPDTIIAYDKSLLQSQQGTNVLFLDAHVEFVESEKLNVKPSQKTDVQVEVEKAAVPAGMVGTWFFDNPMGDDEQMAIFNDGRVVVLYSNGHKDQSRYENGFIELAEYGNARFKIAVLDNGTLIQYSDSQESGLAKIWRRIDPQPHTELISGK